MSRRSKNRFGAYEGGELLKSIRVAAGVSREELSVRAHIPYQTIYQWEAGYREAPEYISYYLRYVLEDIRQEDIKTRSFLMNQMKQTRKWQMEMNKEAKRHEGTKR